MMRKLNVSVGHCRGDKGQQSHCAGAGGSKARQEGDTASTLHNFCSISHHHTFHLDHPPLHLFRVVVKHLNVLI